MSVTKHGSLNIVIGLLIAASLALLCIPCFTAGEDSASVMSYIFMVTEHDGVTDLLEELRPGFVLNGQVWTPILMFVLGLAALYFLIAKRNLTVGLYLPMIYSIFGILICWTNELTRLGGVTVWPTLLLLAAFVLCLLNGNWTFGETASSWKQDPHAKSKLRNIEKAVAKRNIETLKAYAQSEDVSVRIPAIDGIASVGGTEAFQPLVAQLSCPNSDVRIAAAKALSRLGDPRGRSFIMHYMASDPDSRVRSAMRSALSSLPSQSA